MKIESNNEIVSFSHYLLANKYAVNPVSEELKRRYFIASRGDKYYMIELGALGEDKDGYGIYQIQNPKVRERVSPIVPIIEFDAEKGIAVH